MTDWRKLTRGERNNNPGNIKELQGDNTEWIGEHAEDLDSVFEEFETPYDGVVALAKIIKTYKNKHGLDTIRKIITRYAPSGDNNNTEKYIEFVSGKTGAFADSIFVFENKNLVRKMVLAIIIMEQGRCLYSEQMIFDAVDSVF